MEEKLSEILLQLDLPATLADQGTEEIIDHIRKHYIHRAHISSDEEIVNKITGRRMGSLQTSVLRSFDMAPADVKDKKIEEIIQLGINKWKTKFEELEKKGGNEKTEEKLKEALAETERFRALNEELTGKIQQSEKDWTDKLRHLKIQEKMGALKNSIPFVDYINPLTRQGFDHHIENQYSFDIDENDNLVVLDKNGNPIDSGRKNEPLGAEELLRKEAAAFNILKMNNSGKSGQNFSNNTIGNKEEKPQRKLPANALQNAEMLSKLNK